MLDTSASMTGTIDLLRAAAEQFVIRLLPGDKARVGAFNDRFKSARRSRAIATNSSTTSKILITATGRSCTTRSA